MGGNRSFRAWVSAFVPVGGGAVIFCGIVAVFRSLRYITALLWRSSSTKQCICMLLYCCSMVGGLLVGGWLGRWVGVSCGTWVVFCRRTGSGCRVGAVVVLCIAFFPCCRILMMCGGFVLFENQVALNSARWICTHSINKYNEMIVTELAEPVRRE